MVYLRPYSGERLCKGCFIETFERRVYKTIVSYGLLRENDRIAVAVSGGKDSLALLRVLRKIEGRFPHAELVAITIDEGIPGYRDESIDIATRYCRGLGVEHHVLSFKQLFDATIQEAVEYGYTGRMGLKPCSLCGVFRRKALNIAAREIGATVIATAHTLDDIVQTYLLNILRGDPPHAPLGVRRRHDGPFVPRVSPFRLTPEEDVVMYSYLCGIPLQSTPCPYASDSQRDAIRSFLTGFEQSYPGSLYTALHYIEGKLMAREEIGGEGGTCKLCGEPSSREICRACELHTSIRRIKLKGPAY